MKTKTKVEGTIKVNAYRVLSDCVEQGIEYGYHRAFKHTDKPDEASIKHQVYEGVMSAISDMFIFDNEVD